MKNALNEKGLSMSQAQTISNLANQAATDMLARLNMSNNYKKTVEFNSKELVQVDARPLPLTLEDQLRDIGDYRALQAFLMENIKAKDTQLKQLRDTLFVSKEPAPEKPNYESFTPTQLVDESWGWDQLSINELAEYWEAEARAAVIGGFIHKGGKLDQLRKELPTIASLEWFVAPGKDQITLPVIVKIHDTHTDEKLWDTHQTLANMHRELEQRVNYYKSKVKNLVTLENARISSENGKRQSEVNKNNVTLRNEYMQKVEDLNNKVKEEIEEFETNRQNKIRKVAALRIQVDERFQKKVDELMPKNSESESEEIEK